MATIQIAMSGKSEGKHKSLILLVHAGDEWHHGLRDVELDKAAYSLQIFAWMFVGISVPAGPIDGDEVNTNAASGPALLRYSIWNLNLRYSMQI